jgi:hypothetical protein
MIIKGRFRMVAERVMMGREIRQRTLAPTPSAMLNGFSGFFSFAAQRSSMISRKMVVFRNSFRAD